MSLSQAVLNRGGAADREVVLGKQGMGKEDSVGQVVDHQAGWTQGQGVDHLAGQAQGLGVAAEVSLLTRKAVCGAVQGYTTENLHCLCILRDKVQDLQLISPDAVV